jgi:hypothetical protein
MADDFEDIYDIENMTDDELESLIREELDDYPQIDPSRVDVAVNQGNVTVSGRVGTEAELQSIEQVLTDVIGFDNVTNDIVVDRLTRAQHADAADVAAAEVRSESRGQRGGANSTEDTAAHLLDDTGAEQYGTGDVGEAVERGYSYNPPSTPIQEGQRGAEEH